VFLPNIPFITQVGPAGLKTQAGSIFFFFFGLGPTQPVWAGLGWTQAAQLDQWPKPVTLLGSRHG